MQGFDVILGAFLIGFLLLFCLGLLLADVISRRRRERAARGRLQWLDQRIKGFSLSLGWRWFFRCGYRRGRKKGREEGFSLGMQRAQRIVVENRCAPHGSNLHPQLVKLYDGRFVQGWFCTCWEAHTVHPDTGKIEHPFPVKRFEAQKQLQSQLVPLTETQELPIVHHPKKVKLSS